mgnify:CR=1 FL=1
MKITKLLIFSFLALISLHANAQQNREMITKEASANRADPNRDVCLVVVNNFEWSSLQIVMNIYSTHLLDTSCDVREYHNLTMASIKAQLLGVQKYSSVFRGGVQRFLMDVDLSPNLNPYYILGNLRVSLVGTINIGLIEFIRSGKSIEGLISTPYKSFEINKDILYVWNKGSTAHQLVDPDGNKFIMFSYTNDVYPNLNRENLDELEPRLELPKGWKYEKITLDKIVTIRSTTFPEPTNRVVFDVLGNFYLKYK